MIDYEHIEQKIGYVFKDKNLLEQCFTHSSYANEHKRFFHNERLEFFGDSILGFIVTEYLYRNYPGYTEGKLTRMKQSFVSSMPLAAAIDRLELCQYLLLGNGEKKQSDKVNLAENLFEALVSGIYLDGGLDECKKFVYDKLINVKSCINTQKPNEKGKLQEYVQAKKLGKIVYRLDDKQGPDHNPVFFVTILLNDVPVAQGMGKSKQSAEQNSAEKAYKILKSKR
ncbi:MAG: ribonuclease III [Christensenellaceae bacterium]